MRGRAGVFLWVVLGLAFLLAQVAASQEEGAAPAGDEGGKGAAPQEGSQGAEPDPAFKAKKGADAFKKARSLFEEEKYREALAELKKVKDQGKTAGDRTSVDRWIKACEGGAFLDNYRKMAERGALRSTYFNALEAAGKFRGTPIVQRFDAFLDDLRGKVIQVLESFDVKSPRYSEKFGKRFVDDPKLVFRGARCLEWTSPKDGKPSQLLIKDVPSKWGAYHSLVFWVRYEQPVELTLLAVSPGSGGVEASANVMQAAYSPPGGRGWVRAEVELDKFTKVGAASFGNVEKFVFQVESKTTYKLYLDEIGLVRKDSPENREGGDSPSGKADKDQKKSKKKPAAREKQG